MSGWIRYRSEAGLVADTTQARWPYSRLAVPERHEGSCAPERSRHAWYDRAQGLQLHRASAREADGVEAAIAAYRQVMG